MLKRKQLNQAFKQQYKDKIIHQSKDRFGLVQVIDDGMIRSLHFDAIEKQSAMNLEKPEELVLSYTQFMMAGFLFNEHIDRILCIGLGGGSIPRYLAHHIGQCKVDVVEIRPLVISIALKHFMLPTDKRFRYFEGDCAEFVKGSSTNSYDLILVDAFDKNGLADAVKDSGFVSSCANILRPNGIFCINLWSHPLVVYRDAKNEIHHSFGNGVIEIPVKDRTNRIVLGIKPEWQIPSLQILRRRSTVLESTLNLPFPKLLDFLVKKNRELFKSPSL